MPCDFCEHGSLRCLCLRCNPGAQCWTPIDCLAQHTLLENFIIEEFEVRPANNDRECMGMDRTDEQSRRISSDNITHNESDIHNASQTIRSPIISTGGLPVGRANVDNIRHYKRSNSKRQRISGSPTEIATEYPIIEIDEPTVFDLYSTEQHIQSPASPQPNTRLHVGISPNSAKSIVLSGTDSEKSSTNIQHQQFRNTHVMSDDESIRHDATSVSFAYQPPVDSTSNSTPIPSPPTPDCFTFTPNATTSSNVFGYGSTSTTHEKNSPVLPETIQKTTEEYDSTADTTNRQYYYTFTSRCGDLSTTINNYNRNKGGHKSARPISFAYANHGDHYHFVFKSTTGNASRFIKRLAEALKFTSDLYTEAHLTIQRIRSLTKFLLYLLRKNIRKFGIVGSGLAQLIEQVRLCFGSISETDNPQVEACEKYFEDIKDKKNYTKALQNESRHALIDFLGEIKEIYKFTSYIEYLRMVPNDIKIRLLKEHGTTLKSYILSLCQMQNAELKEQLRNTHYLSHVLKSIQSSEQNIKNLIWIEKLFIANEIHPDEFYAHFILIQTRYFEKKNGFVLLGQTNMGKSLLMESLLEPIQPTVITKSKDRSTFHLDQLPISSAILFQEPWITTDNVGDWKLLLEGKRIDVDQKHSDKEAVLRQMVVITTNTPLNYWLTQEEADPLYERLFLYTFKHYIPHYLNTQRQQKTILTEPPGSIHFPDFAWHILYHLHGIEKKISDIEKQEHKQQNYIIHNRPIDLPANIFQNLYIERKKHEYIFSEITKISKRFYHTTQSGSKQP